MFIKQHVGWLMFFYYIYRFLIWHLVWVSFYWRPKWRLLILIGRVTWPSTPTNHRDFRTGSGEIPKCSTFLWQSKADSFHARIVWRHVFGGSGTSRYSWCEGYTGDSKQVNINCYQIWRHDHYSHVPLIHITLMGGYRVSISLSLQRPTIHVFFLI